jgi:hypothetical protein
MEIGRSEIMEYKMLEWAKREKWSWRKK